MLNLDQCRKLIGADETVTDEELEQIREQVYMLANIVISDYINQSLSNDEFSNNFENFIRPLPPKKQRELKRRTVSIAESENLSLDEAERIVITKHIAQQRD